MPTARWLPWSSTTSVIARSGSGDGAVVAVAVAAAALVAVGERSGAATDVPAGSAGSARTVSASTARLLVRVQPCRGESAG